MKTVERALGLLRCVGEKGGSRGLGLVELSKEAGIHKSTVFRYTTTLVRLGFLEQDPDTERYRLGTAILELAGLCLADMEIRQQAMPYLQDLVTRTGETVHLGILDGSEVVYIEKVESPGPIRLHSIIGGRAPAHCTALGKAMLAHCTEEEVTQVLKDGMVARTPNSITDPLKLREDLVSVRSRGYAVDDEENREGIYCLGAPIFGFSGRPIAAVSITGLASAMTPAQASEKGIAVKDIAERISRRMGYYRKRTPPG